MTVCYTVGSQVHRLELHMWCTGTVTTTQRQASQIFQRQREAKIHGAVPLKEKETCSTVLFIQDRILPKNQRLMLNIH